MEIQNTSIVTMCKDVCRLDEYILDAKSHDEPVENLEIAFKNQLLELSKELTLYIENVEKLEKEEEGSHDIHEQE